MNNAYELFTAVPKQHNCAQAVADGFGDHALSEAMKVCGGGNGVEKHLQGTHADTCTAALQPCIKLPSDLLGADTLAVYVIQALYAVIDVYYLVPRSLTHYSVLGKIEDTLKISYRTLGLHAEVSVRFGYHRNGRIVPAYAVKA